MEPLARLGARWRVSLKMTNGVARKLSIAGGRASYNKTTRPRVASYSLASWHMRPSGIVAYMVDVRAVLCV